MAISAAKLGSGPGGVGRTNGQSFLKLWLKVDMGVTQQNDRVQIWADSSGCGNHAKQAETFRQPQYIPENSEFNGKPTLRFTGQQFLRLSHQASLDMSEAMTVFVVFKPAHFYQTQAILSKCKSGVGNYALLIQADQPRLQFEHHHQAWWQFTSQNVLTTRPTIITFGFDPRYNGGAFGVNGQLVGQFRDNYKLRPNFHSLKIGYHTRDDQQGWWLNGDLAELILYNGTVNTAQRIIIENYLSAKYDIAPLPRNRHGKDIYAGNSPQYGSYAADVAGIGQEADGTHREAYSAGLTILDKGFLQAKGDYLLCGHNVKTNGLTREDLPFGITQRWQRVWFMDLMRSNLQSGEVMLIFNHLTASAEIPQGRYVLLERAQQDGEFSVIAESTEVTAEAVMFTLSADLLIAGRYYTLGLTPQQALPQHLLSLGTSLWEKFKADITSNRPQRGNSQPRALNLVAGLRPLWDKPGALTPLDVERVLEQLLKWVRHELPRDILVKVEAIQQLILDSLPYIKDLNSSEPQIFALRQITFEYLPEALEYYLNLPPVYANQELLQGGKTARQILLNQLDLLQQQVGQTLKEAHAEQAKRLLIHGRFLENKFGGDDLL